MQNLQIKTEKIVFQNDFIFFLNSQILEPQLFLKVLLLFYVLHATLTLVKGLNFLNAYL